VKVQEATVIASSPARLTVVEPDGPDDVLVPGFTASTRLTSAETGSISIVEHTFAPGSLVPPHRHTKEDEISYVVLGEIGFRSNEREVSLPAGGYIVKPRGELHAMWNASSAPARMIEIISPAGFERYFVELAEAIASAGGQRDAETVGRVAARYGLEFDFGSVAELVERHGLTPQVR
jgi:quercetin dioxygenase-like cupin family protein